MNTCELKALFNINDIDALLFIHNNEVRDKNARRRIDLDIITINNPKMTYLINMLSTTYLTNETIEEIWIFIFRYCIMNNVGTKQNLMTIYAKVSDKKKIDLAFLFKGVFCESICKSSNQITFESFQSC
jgi:hypothetical protein